MSGNFDFPPASGPSNRQSNTNEDIYLQGLIQGMASSERTQRRVMDSVGESTPGNARRHRIRQEAIREEIRRRHAARVSQVVAGLTTSNTQAPTSAVRSRPQVLPSVRHLRRHINRQQEASNLPINTHSLQQAVARLNEASSSLGSLLDQPIPNMGSPDISAREYSGEAEVNRRRAKRRRLDGDPLSAGFKAFSYGYRGQVVSGPLKMEIVSCDGGLHEDAANHGRDYWPENVLRNDKSVYCTHSNKCNIIMCHQGETAFCVRKIVIKAPERGFTAPIQEGLIFISMTSKDLLTRTARYEVREPPPLRVLSSEDLAHDTIPTLPRVMPPREPHENRPPSRRIDGSIERAIPPPIADVRAFPSDDAPHPFPLLDLGDDSSPPPRTITPPDLPSFNISTGYSDNSGDEEEESSAATLADRYRRDSFPIRNESSEEETEDGSLSRWVPNRARAFGLPHSQRRSRRRANPSRIEIAAPSAEENQSNSGQKPSGNTEVLAPHARFFIDQHKSMISIKFDPLVSGRFILLKMWSPVKDQNIDIQSIVVYGYGGPRCFPSAQLM